MCSIHQHIAWARCEGCALDCMQSCACDLTLGYSVHACMMKKLADDALTVIWLGHRRHCIELLNSKAAPAALMCSQPNVQPTYSKRRAQGKLPERFSLVLSLTVMLGGM